LVAVAMLVRCLLGNDAGDPRQRACAPVAISIISRVMFA
jgi:hypothetical protein